MAQITELGRFYDPQWNVTREGLVDRREGLLHLAEESILATDLRIGSQTCELAGLVPLPCVQAPLMVGAALNYVDHAAEANLKPPAAPLLFGIAPGALLGDGGELPFPTAADLAFGLAEPYVDPEAELVAVIGAEGQIVGYAAGNDVSERTWQSAVGARGLPWLFPDSIGGEYEYAWFKSLAGFKPLGSLYRGDIDPRNIRVQMLVNGQVVQDGNTRDMIFSVEQLAAETAAPAAPGASACGRLYIHRNAAGHRLPALSSRTGPPFAETGRRHDGAALFRGGDYAYRGQVSAPDDARF